MTDKSTAAEISTGLETMAALFRHWDEYNVWARAREGLTTEPDTHVITVPPEWPRHGTLRNWSALLDEAAKMLAKSEPASPSPPPSAGVDAVGVKALEWEGKPGVRFADTRIGTYWAFADGTLKLDDTQLSFERGRSWEATQAAAQADYAARIRSALTPAPTPVEAGGEAEDVWVLFSDGHPLFLSGSKTATDKAKKAYAETGHTTDGPFRYALAKPASAVEAVREALSKAETRALVFAQNYGPNVSFAGERRSITTAQHLIARGLISGSYQNASITDKGVAALAALAPAAQAGTVAQEGER